MGAEKYFENQTRQCLTGLGVLPCWRIFQSFFDPLYFNLFVTTFYILLVPLSANVTALFEFSKRIFHPQYYCYNTVCCYLSIIPRTALYFIILKHSDTNF